MRDHVKVRATVQTAWSPNDVRDDAWHGPIGLCQAATTPLRARTTVDSEDGDLGLRLETS